MMRYSKGDESFSYHSLDVPFHYQLSLTPSRRAEFNHKSSSRNQFNLSIGDRYHEILRPNYKSR